MSKRAEELAKQLYPDPKLENYDDILVYRADRDNALMGRVNVMHVYEQAEKDLTNAAALSSGPDGFYYGKGYQQGKKDAEKHLGWHSVEESLPPVDEEVIVLRDELSDYLLPDAGFVGVGHIVDRRYAMDYNGWNVPGVKYWMPMPKLPNEDE